MRKQDYYEPIIGRESEPAPQAEEKEETRKSR